MGTVTMRVFRGDASGGSFVDYVVDVEEGQVVLDVIHRIQATQANDLAVRWNCKAGKCGSCSAEVNGHPCLMCMTRMNAFEPGKPISDRVKQRAVAVAQALDAIQVVGGALGVEIASQERLNRLNDLIGSLKAGTEIDTETASKAEVVASMLPQIADKARAIGEADKGKALVPLLIQRDMEQAMLNAARVQVAVLRKRLALREAVVIARVKQADTLFNAHNWVRLVATCDRATFGDDEVSLCHKVRMGQPMHGMWGALPPKGRRTLLESITQYLDAYARQGADIDAMTTQELALAQERNLQLSEVNAAMWSTLIDATVRQSAEFSALGLKADDFEKLLNILGIFYIGHGVNK